jgi:hypothetical protein
MLGVVRTVDERNSPGINVELRLRQAARPRAFDEETLAICPEEPMVGAL